MPRRRPSALAFTGALAAVVAGAAVLRLWQIDQQPGGLFQDEAAEGYDAWRLLHVAGFHPLFFDGDGGREVPFAYAVAAAFRVFGDSVTTLRATAAVIGVLGVAATPIALRRFGRPAALAGTAWAAGSLWLLCVSRDGFRNITVALAGVLTLAALLAWSDADPSRMRRRAAVAGGVGAAGLWTYQPLKLVPLWVALWLLWTWRHNPAAFARIRRGIPAAAVAYAVVAAPLAYVAVTDPSGYFGRGLAVSAANPDQSLSALPLHILRTLAMVGVTGDPNQRHDVATVPLLPPLVALVFALGCLRAWRRRDDPGHTLLLAGLPVFVLPGLLSLEGDAPHFLRALGLVAPVAGLVGLGACESAAQGRRLFGSVRGGAAGAALPVVALAAAAVQSATLYLSRDEATRYYPYSYDLVALAELAHGPHNVVVLDSYRGLVVDFVDRADPPRRVDPGTRPRLFAGDTVWARNPADLDASIGAGASGRAQVAARDPDGNPVVWRLDPGGPR